MQETLSPSTANGTKKPRRNSVKQMPENTSRIFAKEYNVVVLPDKTEEVTSGGIIIPEKEQDRLNGASTQGILVHASPLAFSYGEWADEEKPKTGDRVVFAKYVGMIVEGKDKKDYRILADKDIVAVIDA